MNHRSNSRMQWVLFAVVVFVVLALFGDLYLHPTAQLEVLATIVVIVALLVVSTRVFDLSELKVAKEGLTAKLAGVQEQLAETTQKVEANTEQVANQGQTLGKQQVQVNEQEEKIRAQQEIINKLVTFSMSFPIFNHLRTFRSFKQNGREYNFHNEPDFKRDWYHLRDHGYVESSHDGVFINLEGFADGQDMVPHIKLTPIGDFLVDIRNDAERPPAPRRDPGVSA